MTLGISNQLCAARLIASLAFLLIAAFVPANAQTIVSEDCEEGKKTGLPVCEWNDPAQQSKGCVLLVHGLTQRGICLDSLARTIVNDGFNVWAIDQRGHGYWHFKQSKGADGYTCDFNRSTDDIVALVRTIKSENPNVPLYCIGESAGAAVITRAAVKAPDAIDGLVLCSAGVKGCHFHTMWVLHDLCISALHPISVMRYQKLYASDNEKDLQESMGDPCVRRFLTAREVLRVKNVVCGTARVVKRLDPRIPILVLQGTVDHVLRPSSASKIMHSARTSDKALVMIPGCGHVMLGTNHLKPLVVTSINAWLNREATVAIAGTTLSSAQ